MAEVTVSRRAIESIRAGHPWIFRSAIVRARGLASSPNASSPNEAGSIARFVTEDGTALGAGIYDDLSPIAGRVWALGPTARVDAALFTSRLERAFALRRRLFADGTTTAYRLLNGEGDRMPGFVIDRYADVAVLRVDGDAARSLVDRFIGPIEEATKTAGITTLLQRIPSDRHASERGRDTGSEARVTVRFGPTRSKIEVKEHGVPFVVDVERGQKTGAFLDQRENRRRIGDLVRRRVSLGLSARVLNLFSYTGGFSLRAALAGGTVTSVDVASRAHATAQESFRLAGIDPTQHAFAAADAFAWLDAAKKRGERWDIVISDPPSFAPSEKAKLKAIGAYRQLHRACAEVLAPEGMFVAASCSSHVGTEEFLGTLDDHALGRGDLSLVEVHGQPEDHPTLPAFPEGRYLKLAVLA